MRDWQAFNDALKRAREIEERGSRVDRMVLDRAFRLAATVGIPRDGCCLHNASIDDAMTGWCYRNPERLKVAKRAAYLASQWKGGDIARRISERIVRAATIARTVQS